MNSLFQYRSLQTKKPTNSYQKKQMKMISCALKFIKKNNKRDNKKYENYLKI